MEEWKPSDTASSSINFLGKLFGIPWYKDMNMLWCKNFTSVYISSGTCTSAPETMRKIIALFVTVKTGNNAKSLNTRMDE